MHFERSYLDCSSQCKLFENISLTPKREIATWLKSFLSNFWKQKCDVGLCVFRDDVILHHFSSTSKARLSKSPRQKNTCSTKKTICSKRDWREGERREGEGERVRERERREGEGERVMEREREREREREDKQKFCWCSNKYNGKKQGHSVILLLQNKRIVFTDLPFT